MFLIFAACAIAANVDGQVRRELSVSAGSTIEVVNRHGKVEVTAIPSDGDAPVQSMLSANGKTPIAENELEVSNTKGSVRIEVRPAGRGNRVDIALTVPARTRLKVTTLDG